MGWFGGVSDRMNDEFVAGGHNVRRYEEDPHSLDELLTQQHARGIGSARRRREDARASAAAEKGTLSRIAPRPQLRRSACTCGEPMRLV